MTVTQLPVGTRVYYKGDMANADGFGSIMGHFNEKTVNIGFDDGREFKAVFAAHFENSRFQRFYLADNWKAQQDAAIIQLQRQYEETLKRKDMHKEPCGMCCGRGHYPIPTTCPQCNGSGWIWK